MKKLLFVFMALILSFSLANANDLLNKASNGALNSNSKGVKLLNNEELASVKGGYYWRNDSVTWFSMFQDANPTFGSISIAAKMDITSGDKLYSWFNEPTYILIKYQTYGEHRLDSVRNNGIYILSFFTRDGKYQWEFDYKGVLTKEFRGNSEFIKQTFDPNILNYSRIPELVWSIYNRRL